MKQIHYPSWKEDLKKELKNPIFRKAYEEAGERLEIAVALAQMRHKAKISQKKLAKKMRMKQSAIARIEMGDQNLTIGTLRKFAAAFGKKLRIKFV